jgi:hypothetical protein
MKKNFRWTILIITLILFGSIYWFPTEWTRRMISVRVVDAQTGEPIEGAVVFYDWFRTAGIPGLTHSVDLEAREGMTDSQGFFRMPNYSFAQYHMAAYKPGYVCWSNRDAFLNEKRREVFRIYHGSIIKLEHFREEYSRQDHVDFMDAMTTGNYGGNLFKEAIKAEKQIAQSQTGSQ